MALEPLRKTMPTPVMTHLERFLDPSVVSLKICGVRSEDDARRLIGMGVDALGVNFWDHSKRYLDPASAAWLKELEGSILRVGVFVNASAEFAIQMVREGLIDVVQLHGDETPEDAAVFRELRIPFIKALGVGKADDLALADRFGATALLLDAHAPGVYGGTGATFDWHAAVDYKRDHSELPLVLAGGITPANAADAVAFVKPAALDVASGAEHAPGVKDFEKVAALLAAIGNNDHVD